MAALGFWKTELTTTTVEVDLGSFPLLTLAALLILALAVVVVQARRRTTRK